MLIIAYLEACFVVDSQSPRLCTSAVLRARVWGKRGYTCFENIQNGADIP